MAFATNIQKRKGSANYYARMAVPNDLQQRMGTPDKPRKEVWKSLGPSAPKEAKRLARPGLEAWERRFDELRQVKELSEGELQDAIWRRYLELITADEKFRLAQPTPDDLDAIWKHIEAEFGEYDIHGYRLYEAIRDRLE